MLRVMLLPLLTLLLVMSCMAQTFQYSHGWTNGKRAVGANVGHLHRDDEMLIDLLEGQDTDRRLEKCLLQLQRFVRNPLLMRAGYPGYASSSNNNNLYGTHHQSNELYEELNGAEASDFGKH